MALRVAIANGNWDAAGTWTGGIIPGTGDEADLDGFTVTLRDSRTVWKITMTNFGSILMIDPTLLGASITLTFDDTAGAGLPTPTHSNVGWKTKGNATFSVTIKSAVSNPANRWALAVPIEITDGLNFTTLEDFDASGIAKIERNTGFADPGTWATITNCTFKSNVARGSVFLDRGVRAINPVFDNVDYRRVPGGTGIPPGVFMSGATFINGSLFLIVQVNGGVEFIASKNHAGVANDYVLVNANVNLVDGQGYTTLDDILVGDRPGASDNLKIGVNAAGGSVDSIGAVKTPSTGSITVASLAIRNGAKVRTGAGELHFTGTLTLSNSLSEIVSEAGGGRVIQDQGTTYNIWAGTATRKVNVVNDFVGGDNVTLKIGTFDIDENAAFDSLTTESVTTLKISSGATVTTTSGGKIKVKGSIQITGTSTNRIKLRSSVPGTKWKMEIDRGKLFLDRAVLAAADEPVDNFGIQGIQEPVMSYFATGDRSQMTYIAVEGGSNNSWRIMSYNHATNTWSGPFKFDTANQAEGDGHKFGSIIHDKDGFMHILYDSHEEPFKHIKSNAADNDASVGAGGWTAQAAIGTANTYPNLARGPDAPGGSFGNGTVYLHKRNDAGDYGTWFRKSTDNMATFSADLKLIDRTGFDRSYAFGIRITGQGTIHIFGNFRTSSQNHNPYYLKSEDGGATWKKADGTTLTLPATNSTIDHPAGIVKATSIGGGIDADGNPHLVYIEHDVADPATTTKIKHTRWNGSSWTTPVDLTASGSFPTSGSRWADWSSGKAIVYNDVIYVVWTYATAQIDPTTGTVTGDLYSMFSTSSDLGETWSHSLLRKFTGAPSTYTPAYTHVREIPEKTEVHAFWSGEPNTLVPGVPGPFTSKDFVHEEVRIADPHKPRQAVFTFVDVQDSDATGGVVCFAE